MNVKEYIESGMLEAYVLGALTDSERAQVQADIARYPELAAEVLAIEAAMQQFAEANAVEPPTHLQDKIWNALQSETNTATANADGITAQPQTIPFTPAPAIAPMWQRAAIWIALVGSLLANFLLWSQNNKERDDRVAMQQQQTSMQQHLDSMQAQQQQYVAQMKEEKAMAADTSMQTVVMHTMQKDHPMVATVYWNKNKGEAYVSVGKLPMPPKGMQYQLWVMQDGKPVDMGVLPNNMVSVDGMQKVSKIITNGQAFAISLEKEGGSPVPTMANIYVMGKVAS